SWERRYLQTLKLVSRIRVITHPRGRMRRLETPSSDSTPGSTAPEQSCTLVAIGTSTGGPGALVEILRALPEDFRLPLLVVLHISEPFGAAFAEWLDTQTRRRVSYPHQGDPLSSAAGRVLMAPPGQHLILQGGRFHLTRDPERHSCRPSVDVLFESIAKECGPSSAGCLLTGMGRDGAAGLLALKRAGALTIAQDEASCIVYGMPREAVLLNAAQRVLPLADIAPALARLGARSRGARP
ncbi:MAG: CheB methylesterase domain-containing protein, partial [Deltaproteobacteria bacterium]